MKRWLFIARPSRPNRIRFPPNIAAGSVLDNQPQLREMANVRFGTSLKYCEMGAMF